MDMFRNLLGKGEAKPTEAKPTASECSKSGQYFSAGQCYTRLRELGLGTRCGQISDGYFHGCQPGLTCKSDMKSPVLRCQAGGKPKATKKTVVKQTAATTTKKTAATTTKTVSKTKKAKKPTTK